MDISGQNKINIMLKYIRMLEEWDNGGQKVWDVG